MYYVNEIRIKEFYINEFIYILNFICRNIDININIKIK